MLYIAQESLQYDISSAGDYQLVNKWILCLQSFPYVSTYNQHLMHTVDNYLLLMLLHLCDLDLETT
jgi:hypothetical protein